MGLFDASAVAIPDVTAFPRTIGGFKTLIGVTLHHDNGRADPRIICGIYTIPLRISNPRRRRMHASRQSSIKTKATKPDSSPRWRISFRSPGSQSLSSILWARFFWMSSISSTLRQPFSSGWGFSAWRRVFPCPPVRTVCANLLRMSGIQWDLL